MAAVLPSTKESAFQKSLSLCLKHMSCFVVLFLFNLNYHSGQNYIVNQSLSGLAGFCSLFSFYTVWPEFIDTVNM